MFKLNRLTDYGVVVLVRMAQEPAILRTAPDIARDTGVPLPTVSKVLSAMAHGDLVASTRGAGGGYCLARAPQEITVAEVIQALEGPIALTACVEGADETCDVERLCPMRGNWNKVNRAIYDALSQVTLADMRMDWGAFGAALDTNEERVGH